MDLLVFFILFLFTMALFAGVNYYLTLFSQGRSEYNREELINIREMIDAQLKQIFSLDDKTFSYLVFGASIFIGFLFSYLGGLYSNHFESYFFHSAILPLLLFFLVPYFRDQLPELEEEGGVMQKVFQNEPVIFLGFSTSTAAQILAAYGLYHGISFLWAFLNYLVILVLMILKVSNGKIGEKFSFKKSGEAKKR